VNSKSPLQIADDRIIITTLFPTAIPTSKIVGIGEHPTRKTPSLSYRDPDKGHSGELALPWSYIAEPQSEVLSRIRAVIGRQHHDPH
jgi:hypothetical protein